MGMASISLDVLLSASIWEWIRFTRTPMNLNVYPRSVYTDEGSLHVIFFFFHFHFKYTILACQTI